MSNWKREPDESFEDYRKAEQAEEKRIRQHSRGRSIWSANFGTYRRSVHGVIGTLPENKRRRGY